MICLDTKLNKTRSDRQKPSQITSPFYSPMHSYPITESKKPLIIKERPFKQNSQELSFKGLSFYKYSEVIKNFKKLLGVADKYLANVPSELIDKIKKLDSSQIKIDGDSIQFKEKSILKLAFDGLTYPVKQLPLDLMNFGVDVLKKIPAIKNSKSFNKWYDSSFLMKNRNKLLMDEQVASLRGLFKQLSEKGDNEESVKEILKKMNSTFDPKLGNYDSVKERALNRIVSGTIPAFYLANDAYNLSRCCDDNKEKADKEHKIRFKQEMMRVFGTSYLQLAILGGLQKFVNSTIWGTALTTAGITVATEIISRKLSGKSVKFLSEKEAHKQHIKENAEEYEKDKNPEFQYFSMPAAFNFKKSNLDNQNKEEVKIENKIKHEYDKEDEDIENICKIKDDDNDEDEEIKSKSKIKDKDDEEDEVEKFSRTEPKEVKKNSESQNQNTVFTLKHLGYGALASIGIGFSVLGLRKNKSIDNAFNSATKPFNDLYKKLTEKDFIVKADDLKNLSGRLKKAGFDELAKDYDKILEKNANINDINLGKTSKKSKPLVNFVIAPFKFVWSTVAFPFRVTKNILGTFVKPLADKNKKCKTYEQVLNNGIEYLLDNTKKMNDEEFKAFMSSKTLSAFNTTTKSNYSNADLAKLTKLFSSLATSYFLVADNYNMVMTKSDGKDKKGARLKAKERVAQRLSALFYQTMFIDLFNSSFRKLYNSSLLGMSLVTGVCTYVCENFTRASIGMPIHKKTRDEIIQIETKNQSREGIVGDYFRFMSKVTGKKILTQRQPKKQGK